ncbi:MAG: TetR/AcrR family transcriptional regulator [Oscillospiraceae bacterium]|nr:TetR/AcrR family transcriptional regulator [Oscillospiraceae bacterium]
MAKKKGDFLSARASILDAASTLFSMGGIREASLADIAQQAKMSKGTLYYYYPTKDHLVEDIAEEHLSRITDMLFGWIDALGGETGAREALDTLFSFLMADEKSLRLHVVLQSEAALGNALIKKRLLAKYREWTLMLEVGALKLAQPASGRLRDISRIFFAAVDGLALHELIDGGADNRDAMVRLLLGEA